MYSIKSIGPRILPWGTPDFTGSKSEVQSFTDTHWKRLNKYDLNQHHKLPVTNIHRSQLHQQFIVWDTVKRF